MLFVIVRPRLFGSLIRQSYSLICSQATRREFLTVTGCVPVAAA